jgi:hypothetical protein
MSLFKQSHLLADAEMIDFKEHTTEVIKVSNKPREFYTATIIDENRVLLACGLTT